MYQKPGKAFSGAPSLFGVMATATASIPYRLGSPKVNPVLTADQNKQLGGISHEQLVGQIRAIEPLGIDLRGGDAASPNDASPISYGVNYRLVNRIA